MVAKKDFQHFSIILNINFISNNNPIGGNIIAINGIRCKLINLLLSFLEKAKFLKLGCEIEFVEGQIDETNPEALLLQAISYALPEIENKKISKRRQSQRRKHQ